MKLRLLVGIFWIASAFAMSEEEGVRRVQAHLLIDDSQMALQEAKNLVAQYPKSREAARALIEAFSAAKMEEEAIETWHALSLRHPDLMDDHQLMEEMAWGVLKKGLDSTQNGVRLASLIGIYLTHDVRAVSQLCKMMRDSNAVIRSVAVQMACSYGDQLLKDEIHRLMEEERVWVVRLEVIKALGALRMQSLAPKLQAIVQSEKATFEERQFAIEALLHIYENISFSEIHPLVVNNRAGMRHLACSIASHFELKDAKEEILQLMKDPHPDVRIAALNAFGLYYRNLVSSEEAKEILSETLQDANAAVAITAGWAAMLSGVPDGEVIFEKWLLDSCSENRRLAAAALAATGTQGVPLSLKALKESGDPYVKANLAIGLLGQRMEVSFASDSIYDFLQNEKKMWMWETRLNPLFQVLLPSQIRHVDHIPNYPEAIDQMTRLNLLSLLAIVEDSRASTALRNFLQKKTWGITGVAAATLLQEGDEAALEKVKECLNDHEPNVRLQACLVLGMIGKDPSVLQELQRAYVGADHESKLHILEALGRIGNEGSLSFLMGVFSEPFPILRIAAAAAVIQCVNR